MAGQLFCWGGANGGKRANNNFANKPNFKQRISHYCSLFYKARLFLHNRYQNA